MRFRVERAELGEAVAWVARALPSRPVLPMLAGVRIAATSDRLALSCFDYEVSAQTDIEAKVEDPGEALVPGRLLAEIARMLPDQPVLVDAGADVVELSCGNAEFELVRIDSDDYPELPGVPVSAGVVDGHEFASAVSQVLSAVSRDDTLPMLTGVCVEAEGNVLTLAATDRYRLAVASLRWEPDSQPVRSVIVPARTLAEAARGMACGPVTIALDADGGTISFASADRRLTVRLIGGEFVRYRSRFPAEFTSLADMPTRPLIEAVRRVALVTDRTCPIRLEFSAGEVVIEARSAGRARATETVPAEFAGNERVISFDSRYLLDGLAAAATGAPREDSEPVVGPESGIVAGPHAGPDAQPDAGSPQPPPAASSSRPDPVTARDMLRLRFTSASRPALITCADGPRAAGEPRASSGQRTAGGSRAAGEPRAADGPGAAGGPRAAGPGPQEVSSEPEPSQGLAADFRYLLVPTAPPSWAVRGTPTSAVRA